MCRRFYGTPETLVSSPRGRFLGPRAFFRQRVVDEKNRENEIRREVSGFSRLEAADADHPRRVYDILTADGLRRTKPRPPRD